MSAMAALLGLAWLAIVVLALALAGTLKQLRDVQAALVELGGQLGRQHVPESLRPAGGQAGVQADGQGTDSLAVVLLVDQLCVSCAEVVGEFVELAAAGLDTDAIVLTHSDDERWDVVRHSPARLVLDRATYHRLDPGWRPAVLAVDANGTVRSAVPAGSREALRDAVHAVAGKVTGRK